MYEYTFGDEKLPIDVTHPVKPATWIKYIPDNGEYEKGILETINWFVASQQSSKYPTIGGNVGVGVGVPDGVGLGIGQLLSTQGKSIEYVTGPITTGSLPHTYTVVLAYIL